MHDGTVSLDRAPCELIILLKVDNDDFGVGILGQLLAYADIVIRLKGLASISHKERLHLGMRLHTHELKPIDEAYGYVSRREIPTLHLPGCLFR